MNDGLPHSSNTGSESNGEAIRAAYRRWAGIYDAMFSGVFTVVRRRAAAEVNRLPGTRVLDVGVGTGLALKYYDRSKRITGIDFSPEMLKLARSRKTAGGLTHIEELLEMDAEATRFPPASFDIAVAMFVASVVPHPRRLVAEMRRVVRPGGQLLFVNHFTPERGPRWWFEGALAPFSSSLWRPDFRLDALLSPTERAAAHVAPQPPFGLFTLVRMTNRPDSEGVQSG